MFPIVTSNQPTPRVQNKSTTRMREKMKDMDTETVRDVFFYHTDPSDSSTQYPPSLFDRG